MSEDLKEPEAPGSEAVTSNGEPGDRGPEAPSSNAGATETHGSEASPDSNSFQEDPYRGEPYESPAPENYGSAHPGQALASYQPPVTVSPEPKTQVVRPPTPPPPPPPPPPAEEEDEEEEGMLRMSFMEHLEELRTRILRS